MFLLPWLQVILFLFSHGRSNWYTSFFITKFKKIKTFLVSFRCSGFVWLSYLTGFISLCNFRRPSFIMMANCVLCQVRTKSLYKHDGLQAGSSVDYHLTGFSGRNDYLNWGFLWFPLAFPVISRWCALRDHGVPRSILYTVYYSLSCSYYTLPKLSDLEHR
jgi:hypothetical protein